MKIAVYPGTFDPITNGHLDVIKRALKIFDRLIVLVAHHPEKNTLFSVEERLEMIKEVLKDMKNVEVDAYDGLLVDYVKKKNAIAIIRGMRAVSDFEFEFQMALMNRHLYPDIEILFLFPDERYTYLSSSLIKEVISLGGDVSSFVPPSVLERLRRKLI